MTDITRAASALESGLRRLPEPPVPVGFTAAVLLRTGRLDETRTAARRAAEAQRRRRVSAWPTWAVLLGGGAIGLGAGAYRLLAGDATAMLMPAIVRGSADAVPRLTEPGAVSLGLAAGVLLYLFGLFTSVRDSDRPPSRLARSLRGEHRAGDEHGEEAPS